MTGPDHPIESFDRNAIATRLERVRERTLSLIAGLDWNQLTEQHISILSPMVWDLGHIANFEELWLSQELGGRTEIHAGYAEMFDAVVNPRSTRKDLRLPVARQLLGYMSEVRASSLELLGSVETDARPELLEGGFVYELVAQHEEQHQETLLQALQVLEDPPYLPAQRRVLPPGRVPKNSKAEIPAGKCTIGQSGEGFAYDNERMLHEIGVGAFEIDTVPVSCGRYLEFVLDGGYRDRRLWSEKGWQWRMETGAVAPGNWEERDGEWCARSMNRFEPLQLDQPVTHVSYWEADTFCRWAGMRLPTEIEWEKTALWDPDAGRARRYPWGEEPPDRSVANVDQLAFGPAPIGAYPASASAYGVEQLVGDVWEWTSSDFQPYPGFEAFPYRDYSEIFFGADYKVLRGGSWATRSAVARGTFRNWDYPIRRQIFTGFRCARTIG